jgi:hypothetical protein
MDTRIDGTEEFSNNEVVAESALAPMDSEDQSTSASASKPKKQKATKRQKLASGKTSVQEKLVCRYCGSDDLAPSLPRKNTTKTEEFPVPEAGCTVS